jgi:serine/threonine protein kinase/nucleoside phosphorylase
MREYDLGFIVPLNEEFRVLSELCPVIDSEVHDAIHYYTLELPDSNYRAVAVVLGDMGKNLASHVTERVLNYVKLKVIVLLGIAGALDRDLKLGDVVVANEINEFQAASKAVQEGKTFAFQYSGNHWKTSFALTECARSFEFSDKSLYGAWRDQVKDFRNSLRLRQEQLLLANDFPEIRVGHIASGDTVGASKAYAIELRGIDRKFLAIEMEAAGAAQVAHGRGEPVPIMVIRGVSDFADERKEELDSAGDGVWRKYAMYSASAFLLSLLKAKSFQEIISPRTPLKKGKVLLNKYKILKPLGSGVLGDVYLAEDMVLKRKVAVKHLKPEYAADENALERFREEASTIANLRHQNIAIVHGLEQEEGQSYIVMEYAEKGTLAGFLAEEGPLPIIQAINLTMSLCNALAAVHRQRIFHRDIKPGNILLIEMEDRIAPRLSDFGLSSVSKGSGVYSGTLKYAPPEQLRGDPVDARSDIYSLGAVLYEMLTGRPPFTGSRDEILEAHQEQELLSPKSARKEILLSLEKVVLKALSKKPEDRYQITQEMAKDLEIARKKELEKEKRLRDLYTQAEQYIHDRDWSMVIEMLEAISLLSPNYKDTAQWLAKAQKQITLETAYEQGSTALSQGDWDKAQESFRKIVDIDTDFKDATGKLKEAEKQKHLLSLYTEARQFEEMKKWSEAIQEYIQIINIDPGYRDATQRLAIAGQRDRLRLLYEEAKVLFAEENWQEAAEKFQEVLDIDPQYEDAASKAEEADGHAQSQMLYDEGMEHLENRDFDRAIATFKKIQRSDPGYGVVDVKLAEAEREKRWRDLFEEGLKRHGRRDWQGAIKKFEQLLSESPQYPTASTLLEEAKWRRIHEKTRVEQWLSRLPGVKAIRIGIAVILLSAFGVLGGYTILEIASRLRDASVYPNPTASAPAVVSTFTPIPTPLFTPTSTPYPAPALVSPNEGTSFAKGQDVKLVWEWERDLAENEFFVVKIRLKGEQEFNQMGLIKMPYQFIPASELTQAGTHEWRVAIVSRSGEEKGVSQIWSFEVQ